ncbi:hypothetical protein CC86DRAFT_295214 [Ophiobolus disseminans]|uniref:Uncharacterized protein n=1 Tax=Ophiobolus disseminans TaxID=1469910 RepID=A0A6A6ZW79_9PLEO|nr:hypothetical protein CC86DRAFT_295214 [Ophiobolus disseminans]
MTAPPTKNTSSATASKPETAKQWLQRRLRKLPSIQPDSDGNDCGLREGISMKRPRTAPSSGMATETSKVPPVPSIPIRIQRPLGASAMQPPRPPRPDSGVIRDVNAWLDASVNTPSPPLMGGVSYWKSATVANAKDTAGMQHAIPIVPGTGIDRPSTSHSHHVKSFRRRAIKIHVQMPLLARNRSQRTAARKQTNRRSNSMPMFAIPYEATKQATPPTIMTRRRSFLAPTVRTVSTKGPTTPKTAYEPRSEQSRFRYGSPESARTSEAEGSMERCMHALFGRSNRSADGTRPSTAAAHVTRENSMGDVSDAPTYFSGPPPPSYRSRPASVLTTSSFGCVDGMNPAQRQISQQRAAEQRGVKGKLKRFAQSFAT